MDQLDPIQAALLALDFQNTASTLRPTGRDHVLVIHVGGAWPGSPEMNLTAPLSHVAATGRWRHLGLESYAPVAPPSIELAAYKRE
jgi:hypothetical protein